jgi:hypothetical protein
MARVTTPIFIPMGGPQAHVNSLAKGANEWGTQYKRAPFSKFVMVAVLSSKPNLAK